MTQACSSTSVSLLARASLALCVAVGCGDDRPQGSSGATGGSINGRVENPNSSGGNSDIPAEPSEIIAGGATAAGSRGSAGDGVEVGDVGGGGGVAILQGGSAGEVVEVVVPQGCEGIVDFPDSNLQSAIRHTIAQPEGEILFDAVKALTSLSAHAGKEDAGTSAAGFIADLSGVECLPLLAQLDLSSNYADIGDLLPLSGLKQLTSLTISYGAATDIQALAELTQLTTLNLEFNSISDLSPLAGLSGLESLNLGGNAISDVAPLAELPSLTTIELSANAVTDPSPLCTLPSLKVLRLASNGIDDLSVFSSFTGLAELRLAFNRVDDLSPLVNNPGFDAGDFIGLTFNRLDCDDLSTQQHLEALVARSVEVLTGCE